MRTLLNIAVAALSISGYLFAQTDSKPVPAKWLKDGRLAVPELNFAIDSPGPGSQWSYKDDLPKVDGTGSTAFIADASDASKYVVVVENGEVVGSPNTAQFIQGMRKTLPKSWQILDARLEPSGVPLNDSTKFKVTIGIPRGATLYAYGYIVSGRRGYQS